MEELIVSLRKSLKVEMKVKDGTISINTKKHTRLRVEGDELRALLGFDVIESKRDKVTHGMLYDPQSLVVISDIVHYQQMGDRDIPLLRVLLFEGKFGDIIFKEFEKIQYLPVAKTIINDIHMRITDINLKHIVFTYGKIVVTLHFRKV